MSFATDVVFIHPGNSKRIYQSLATGLAAVEPPVWASLMASFVRAAGHGVAVLDAEALQLNAAQVAETVEQIKPRLVVIVVYGHQPSASTQNMAECGRIAAACKEHSPERPVMLVGGHVASLPERSLREEAADYVSTGEGLYTILDLVEALKASPTEPRLAHVRGLGYRQGAEVAFTPAAPLVTDVDTAIPGQAWDLLPMERYRAHNWHCLGEPSRMPYASMYTSLGCPFHCTFCCIQAPFKSGEKALGQREGVNSYRTWSPTSVVDQLERLAKDYGVRHVKLADEMFVLNREHVLGISHEVIRRGLDLNFWAYARVDTIKEDMLETMRAAGFRWLALGIESGSHRVRKAVGKGISQERVVNTLALLRKTGIHVIANYIFGLPEDDLQSMQETLDLSLELNCEFANFYCAMAYPGSPLYAEALKEGWPLPPTWEGYSQHAYDTLPLPTRYISGPEVLAFRDQAFNTYFNNPRYREHVALTFGSEGAQMIESMTAHKLERKHLPAQVQ